MPDIRSCIPTMDEWLTLKGQYKMALERVLDQNHISSKASNSSTDKQPAASTTTTTTIGGGQGEPQERKRPAVAVDEPEEKKKISKKEGDGGTTVAADEKVAAEKKLKQSAAKGVHEELTKQSKDQPMEIAVDDKALRLNNYSFIFSTFIFINIILVVILRSTRL